MKLIIGLFFLLVTSGIPLFNCRPNEYVVVRDFEQIAEEDALLGDYIILENFEEYDDTTGSEVFETWHDGFDSKDNGAQMGHNPPPYMESIFIRTGKYSAPLYYDIGDINKVPKIVNNSGNSPPFIHDPTYIKYAIKAEITIESKDIPIGKDWSKYSLYSIILWFYGTSISNPAKMYIKLNDSKFYYQGEDNYLNKSKWTRWEIKLSKFNIDLENIESLSIGLEKADENSNSQGLIYIDDIRLYKAIE